MSLDAVRRRRIRDPAEAPSGSRVQHHPMNYFVRTESGAEHGPLSAAQLRDAAKSGALRRGDLVRPDGTVDWFRAERVRGLEFPSDAEPARRIEKVRAPDAVAEPVAPPTEPPAPAELRSAADDGLLRHIEPLAARGFNVRKLDGEEVESVDLQGFLDVLRVSIPAALLGRRGLLVVTNRRVFVANATVFTRALQSAYLDRIDRIGFGGRLAVARLIAGLALFGIGLGTRASTHGRVGRPIAQVRDPSPRYDEGLDSAP